MNRRSLTGPLLLLVVGGLFLWRNLHPEAPVFETIALYWPFLLIGWGLLRLVESLFWRSRGYGSRFSGGEVVLIVLICAFGFSVWQARQHGARIFVANGIQILGNQYDYAVSTRASADGVKRVIFENARGNIKVTGSDAAEVVVTGRKLVRAWSKEEADRANEDTPIEIVPQGDALLVRTNQERTGRNRTMSDDIEVVVPRSVSVESRAINGDYEFADLAGAVELALDRGDVRLSRIGGNARLNVGRSDLIRATDIKGNIDLEGQGSDIDLANVSGQVTITGGYRGALDFKNLAKPLIFEGQNGSELHAQAVPGHISMDLGQFTGKNLVGPVRLMADSRDVRVEQFTDSIQVETERGDIELIPGRAPLPSIDARSGTGRIDLALPPKAVFSLQATAETGDAVNDFGPPIQKEVNGRTAVLTGQTGQGPAIRLTATRGWISVRKEGSLPSTPTPPAVPEPPATPKAPGTQI